MHIQLFQGRITKEGITAKSLNDVIITGYVGIAKEVTEDPNSNNSVPMSFSSRINCIKIYNRTFMIQSHYRTINCNIIVSNNISNSGSKNNISIIWYQH